MFTVKKLKTVDEALSAFTRVMADLKEIVAQNESEAKKIEDDIKTLKAKREATYQEIERANNAITNIGGIVGNVGA